MTIFKISSSGTSPKWCTVAVGGSSEWCTENDDEYMHDIYKNDSLDEYITKVQLLRPNDSGVHGKRFQMAEIPKILPEKNGELTGMT